MPATACDLIPQPRESCLLDVQRAGSRSCQQKIRAGMTIVLSLLFGAAVGLSLGLTGGGGAIFAVPLLVYGLGVPAKEATGISLAAVGATAFIGFIGRWRTRQIELTTGLLFAVAGMLGAPVGTWLASRIHERLLLLMFAGLMLVIAVRMWRQASVVPHDLSANQSADETSCERDMSGALLLSSRCAVLLLLLGLATGLLSGLFGVGGGFVIVPALVLFSGMSIHRAIGTSLMVIALVSLSGIASQLWSGRSISPQITGLFIGGGIIGLSIGQRISRHLSVPHLQRVFAVAICSVAVFVVIRNLAT